MNENEDFLRTNLLVSFEIHSVLEINNGDILVQVFKQIEKNHFVIKKYANLSVLF